MVLFVGVIMATMIVSTAVTSDVLAKKGEAEQHVPDQARDHMSDQAKESAGIPDDDGVDGIIICPESPCL